MSLSSRALSWHAGSGRFYLQPDLKKMHQDKSMENERVLLLIYYDYIYLC